MADSTATKADASADADHTHAEHGEHEHHVIAAKVFVGVLMILLFLTFITVYVSRFDFGEFNMLIAMGIAAVKASLVLAIFMHLRWDTPINNIFFLSSFLFLSLLFIFTLGDMGTRGNANSVNRVPAPIDRLVPPPSVD